MTSPLGSILPSMQCVPPGPMSRKMAVDLSRYESPAVSTIEAGHIPIVWEEAKGANVRDVDGNIYIDLSGGFGVASLGHGNGKVAQAIRRQSHVLMHGLGDVHPHNLRVQLARELAIAVPGQGNKVILCSTGAEAVEVALKTATLFTKRSGFLAFEGGFHGQTYGALAVTSRQTFREPFGRQVFQGVARAPYPYCYRCPLHLQHPHCATACLVQVRDLLDKPPEGVGPIAAVIVEPVQGREGEVVPPPEFLPKLKVLCQEYGALLIFDEMVTGFSRTGAPFASEHFGVVPDITCIGKGMANGFPLSACVGRRKVMDAWVSGKGEAPHSSTFMANPLGCASALATLMEHRKRNLPSRAIAIGNHLMRRLRDLEEQHPLIGDVRGLGAMIGVELVLDRTTKEPAPREAAQVVQGALERGVILILGGPRGNVLSFTPPLTIARRQMDYAVNGISEAIRDIENKGRR